MLPMIVNVNLTKGSKNLAKKKVLVKRIEAIQNLGAMDILCTDKTGTLTENKIDNAKGVIFNVRGGENLSLSEINTAVQVINDKVSEDANIIFGTVIDESLQNEMEVTVVATGVEE